MKQTRLGYLQLTLGASLISFSAVFVELADVGPTIAGFYRNFFGGLFLLIVVAFRRDVLWRGRRPLFLSIVAASLFAVDLSFWHQSIVFVGPGLATLLANFQVFFLGGIGFLVFRETPTWRLFVSIPLAVTGLFLLVGTDWNILRTDYQMGIYLGLISAAAYALFLLVLRMSQSGASRLAAPANMLMISFTVATIMGIEGYSRGESFAIPNVSSWAAMAAYGIFSHSLGWISISRGLVKVDASRAGLLLLSQPTLTFVWDGLFFGRTLTPLATGGATLALAAIYLGSSTRDDGREA